MKTVKQMHEKWFDDSVRDEYRFRRSTASNELFQSNQMINYILITIIHGLSVYLVSLFSFFGIHNLAANEMKEQQDTQKCIQCVQCTVLARKCKAILKNPLHISSNVMNEGFLWIFIFDKLLLYWCTVFVLLFPFAGAVRCFTNALHSFFSKRMCAQHIVAWQSREIRNITKCLMYL